MQFVLENWEYFLVGFYILEKIVKLTPTKYDDIVLDMIWGALKKLIGKNGEDKKEFRPVKRS
jgi:hypothetical protein